MNCFVFLDRDGTLVRDPGFVHRVEDFALLPGVVEGLRRLQASGWKLAIVTNQSGIGRGLFSESDFEIFQKHLIAKLDDRGITIAGTFHCPHAPDQGCRCRKPAPGLFEQARDQLGAELAASWMIGDGQRDARAAIAAGLAGAVWIGGTRSATRTHLAPDFAAAAELIVDGS